MEPDVRAITMSKQQYEALWRWVHEILDQPTPIALLQLLEAYSSAPPDALQHVSAYLYRQRGADYDQGTLRGISRDALRALGLQAPRDAP